MKNRILYIFIGLTLSIFTISVMGLNYILPLLGNVFCLLGISYFCRENIWFKFNWILNIYNIIYCLFVLILNTTIYCNVYNNSLIFQYIFSVNSIIKILWIIFLWLGFKTMLRKVWNRKFNIGFVACIIWYGLLCLFVKMQVVNYVISIVMIIVYILCVGKILKTLNDFMNHEEFNISTSIKFSEKIVVASIGTILIVGCTMGYMFFTSYPMEWKKQEVSKTAELQEIKFHLEDLGFPNEILDDLKENDIQECQQAQQVIVSTADFSLDESLKEVDDGEFQITSIAVCLNGIEKEWKIIHYFIWKSNPNFYGTECIEILPAYVGGMLTGDTFNGQILYEKRNETYGSSYYSLARTQKDTVSATFSFPRTAEKQRGYISYCVKDLGNEPIVGSWFNYIHQRNRLQYPVMTARQSLDTNSDNFVEINTWLQFAPVYE